MELPKLNGIGFSLTLFPGATTVDEGTVKLRETPDGYREHQRGTVAFLKINGVDLGVN